ncbi:chalcone isomerase family protein [Burkholderia alba]|uniref:chalcone isomerase family protein n=1 Tax=Burkholderia alba TaxID=2683677 RepID=UPI002B057937|nr:chalcone isomerase family protein [Burkholderia alba]
MSGTLSSVARADVRRASRWLAALALLCASAAHGGWRDDIAPAQRVGSGAFCVLGFCLYDAELWARNGDAGFDMPFALLLTYRRAIKSERLVDTGLGEIERLAAAPLSAATQAAWRADMARAFGDVAPGDTLCGVYLPGKGARFYANGRPTAEVDDPAFARAFFGIWLDPRTRAKTLRRQLLGDAR